ncbi:hypothetical protein, partial [Staphylococcus epidermidis]|uniref:hypothetical protein n=1 Tax=Staphylococcus epidermidis TaxID=1282 RepID=UPI00079254B5
HSPGVWLWRSDSLDGELRELDSKDIEAAKDEVLKKVRVTLSSTAHRVADALTALYDDQQEKAENKLH